MGRIYPIAVALCWLACITWLVRTKVLPAITQGDPPEDRTELLAVEQPPPTAWKLAWGERPIGYTVSQVIPADQDAGEVRSFVRLENLKLREVLAEFLGGWTFLAQSLGGDDLTLDLAIASRLRLTWDGELQSFETVVNMRDEFDLLYLRGLRTGDGRFRISALTADQPVDAESPFSQTVPLPDGARFNDSLSPRSSLKGLHVGRKWMTPSVNPLSPTGTVRMIETTVESREMIEWEGTTVPAFLAVYRYDPGSATLAGKSLGQAWVADDGRILRQELDLQQTVLRMDRAADALAAEHAAALESPAFERRFMRRYTARAGGATKD